MPDNPKVEQLNSRLADLKNDVLESADVPRELITQIDIAKTPEGEPGDRGFPCFVLAKHFKDSPANIAQNLAEELSNISASIDWIDSFFPVGPYVNMAFDRAVFNRIVLEQATQSDKYGVRDPEDPETWLVEFSAPNTNKPQHLGHVRNNLLGDTVSNLLDAAGRDVIRANLINDRGIHICKSMLAYQKWGGGQTPESTDTKGDHFVGQYYVQFSQALQDEYDQWLETPEANDAFDQWRAEASESEKWTDPDWTDFKQTYREDFFNEYSELGAEAKKLLRHWENGDDEIVELWERMNQWVLDGFETTYNRLGIDFDRVYFESETYEVGRQIVRRGLDDQIFEKREDGAIVFDLEKIGKEGTKVVLRADGTAVYITQDIGTAWIRLQDYTPDHQVYVVGDAQEYHFQVLFGILDQLQPGLADQLEHLAYGMVYLPEGRLKSREGKVVDADELVDEMESLAEKAVRKRYEGLTEKQVHRRANAIGLAALKYYLLDYNPRSEVHFNPEESIQFQGRTGPYCLYTYARIQSIGRKHGGWPTLSDAQKQKAFAALQSDKERALVELVSTWPQILQNSARSLDPSKTTEYLFELAKAFSSLYNDPDHKIIDIDEEARKNGLLLLCQAVANTMQVGLDQLGIETLEQM